MTGDDGDGRRGFEYESRVARGGEIYDFSDRRRIPSLTAYDGADGCAAFSKKKKKKIAKKKKKNGTEPTRCWRGLYLGTGRVSRRMKRRGTGVPRHIGAREILD